MKRRIHRQGGRQKRHTRTELFDCHAQAPPASSPAHTKITAPLATRRTPRAANKPDASALREHRCYALALARTAFGATDVDAQHLVLAVVDLCR